jgi:hypothetical protein
MAENTLSDSAELIALKALIGTVPQTEDMVLGLYTQSIVPADTDTAAIYTSNEAIGGGYARKPLLKASWNVTTNPVEYPAQLFEFTGPLTGLAAIYGYFLLRATTLDLVAAFPFTSGFQPISAVDKLTITVKLGAD